MTNFKVAPGPISKRLSDMSGEKRYTLKDAIGNDVEYMIKHQTNETLTGPFTYTSVSIVGATRSLSGIGKNFMSTIYSIDFQTCYVESHLLGLLKIPTLQVIQRTYENNLRLLSGILANEEYLEMEARCDRLSQALDIISEHIKSSTDRYRPDIISCQEHLIDTGLKDYADL